MGPQHPSTHGVFRLVLELDGEVVVSAQATIGYLHTGIEKTAENKKWQQVVPLIERTDYLGAQSNSLAYALSVEKLLGMEMPDRVKWIRVLLAELQRINSHLVWLGTHAMDLGAVSVMLYCFRERELILNINEAIAGFRLFPSYIRIGGLREDLPRGFHDAGARAAGADADQAARVRGPADGQPDLRQAHARRRVLPAGAVRAVRADGPDVAGGRVHLRRAQGAPLLRATRRSSSTCRGSRAPTCSTGTGSGWPRCTRASASATRRSSASRRPARGTPRTRASRRRPRTRSTPRWKR